MELNEEAKTLGVYEIYYNHPKRGKRIIGEEVGLADAQLLKQRAEEADRRNNESIEYFIEKIG